MSRAGRLGKVRPALPFLIFPFAFLLGATRRRRAPIAIEPNPHHIHAVFERSGQPLTPYALPLTAWSWPTSTWMQRRISALRNAPR